MRDILFVSILVGLVPVCLRRPWLGILAWYWTAYFVPQGLSWGFARSVPFAMIIGSATLLGFVFTKDRKPLPKNAATFFLLACVVHFTLTTIVAYNPALAFDRWEKVMKILLMTFVTMSLFQDRARLRWLYMVPALCLGSYGIKGVLWILRTGGGAGMDIQESESMRVFGPDMGSFADANGIGLAFCMILPLLLYLSREEKRPWLKLIFRVAFGCSIISAIYTFSRGSFLGLAVVLLVLIWRSPWRMRFAVAALVVGIIGAPLAPQRFWDRLGSIREQETAETRDTSTIGRLESYETAWNIAISRPFTGAGFRAMASGEIWDIYRGPSLYRGYDAHSIYFEVLSEHGLLGFGLYIGALVSTLWMLRRLRKRWRNHPEHGYISRYAEMTQLSLYPFLVTGAFIPYAYFDLYFLLLATGSMLFVLSQEAERAEAPSPAAPQLRRSRAIPARPNALPARSRQRPRHA